MLRSVFCTPVLLTVSAVGEPMIGDRTRGQDLMARNLKLNPDLFKGSWPRGTKKEKIRD